MCKPIAVCTVVYTSTDKELLNGWSHKMAADGPVRRSERGYCVAKSSANGAAYVFRVRGTATAVSDGPTGRWRCPAFHGETNETSKDLLTTRIMLLLLFNPPSTRPPAARLSRVTTIVHRSTPPVAMPPALPARSFTPRHHDASRPTH